MKKTYKLSITVGIVLLLMVALHVAVFAEGESGSIVSSGYSSTYVIKNDGSLWGWGGSYTGNNNGYKEVQITPAKILTSVRSVSSNNSSGIAVKKDDTLWGWRDKKYDPEVGMNGVNVNYYE